MALLLRNRASRHYALASGAVFMVAAVIIAVLSIVTPRSGAARLIGLALAAMLVSRGLFRLRQARTNVGLEDDADRRARADLDASKR